METLIEDFSGGLLIWQTIIMLTIILWIYSLVDILKAKFENNAKNAWILMVILMPIFGSLIYIFIGRKQKLKAS